MNGRLNLGGVSGSRILHLSLKREPFAVMITGEKVEEFRKPSKWIKSRLFDKNGCAKIYDYVKFVNGYGADKPYFICKFEEVFCNQSDYIMNYTTFSVGVAKGDYVIRLGKIVERGNDEDYR